MVRFDKDTVYQDYVELYENVLSTLKRACDGYMRILFAVTTLRIIKFPYPMPSMN